MKSSTSVPVEKTLYLTIKQSYFDEIMAGTKTDESRRIKPTTYKKYLQRDGNRLLYNQNIYKINNDKRPVNCMDLYGDASCCYNPEYAITDYNNGVFPFLPIEYKLLKIGVGYMKGHDTAIIEIRHISFEVHKNLNGSEQRFDINQNGKIIENPNGKHVIWRIVFHLGRIRKINNQEVVI